MTADQLSELIAWLRKRLARDLAEDNAQMPLLIKLLKELESQFDAALEQETLENLKR